MSGAPNISHKNNRMQQIRGFCNTVIFDGITNAANQMGLTQTAISHQIATLERDLGTTLIRRVGNKMVLTVAGERFYNECLPILQEVDSLYEKFIIKNNNINENELKIAGYHSGIYHIMPKVLKKILQQQPDLQIEIENANLSDALQQLREKKVDLIFFPMSEIHKDLFSLKTFTINPILLVSKKNPLSLIRHKISPEEIAKQNVLLVDNFINYPNYNNLFTRYNIQSKIKFKNANWELIRFFTKEDIGISFYGNINPQLDEQDNLAQIDLSHLFPPITYELLCSSLALKKSVQLFVDAIDFD